MKVSKKEVLIYIEGLQRGDYEDDEATFWRIHGKLENGKKLEYWMKRYGIEL